MMTYRVVLEGAALPGFASDDARKRLAALIGSSEEVAAKLLGGRVSTVKRGIDQATGSRYVDALTKIGVACHLEEENLELDLDERRAAPATAEANALDHPVESPSVTSAKGATTIILADQRTKQGSVVAKWAVAIVVAAGLLLGGAYYGSPYWVLLQMQHSAKAGEGDRLAQYVDFPAVRQSLKSQMQAMLMKKMQNDEMKGNPFAALGVALAGAMVNTMVDGMVTPEGLANMMNSGKAGSGQGAPPASPSTDTNSNNGARKVPRIDRYYEGLGVFKIEIHDPETDKELLGWVLNRDGWFGWKVTSIRMPALAEN